MVATPVALKPEDIISRTLTRSQPRDATVMTLAYQIAEDIKSWFSLYVIVAKNTWQRVCKVWKDVEDGIKWNIGNGESVKFLVDLWVKGLPALEKVACYDISDEMKLHKVKDYLKAGEWKMIWEWPGPLRGHSFLWLAAKDRLLTNLSRFKRKITSDLLCPRCKDWISLNLKDDLGRDGDEWKVIFGVASRCIWIQRNKFVFGP
ncbi:putative ribonuclease H protein [Senna tora]|uniref:Putative ribonuclease H protein n=1 Tax=Senna tora TaxID=362788 RepID=A0A834WYM2_9FABA|nr:putative ribonuclease H protein [Senna tora]